ncbi:Putative DNA-binding domain protein [uncultured archaeon]|nr:Putative DNA-binding domain protein [uncultured archaeon]
MGIVEKIKGNSGKIQTSLSTILKVILIFSILYSTYFHLWHILFANIFLLFLMFMPMILGKKYQVNIPFEFEFFLFLFVIMSFFLGSIRGLVIQAFFGIAVGFIGFAIMLILFSNSKFKANYMLIVLFSFSFSLAFGAIAEILKYYLKWFLDYQMSVGDYDFAITNLTLVASGALLSSLFGYFYMIGYRTRIMQEMVGKFKNKNPNLFIEKTDSPEEILKLIKKGENERIEFKSTLRANLHTGEHDKKIENSSLKTIVAFLNSEGGILLIGVSDTGEISGIEKDGFLDNDKFNRHFTNLIKERIGNEYLPYMNFELVLIEGKNIMRVECRKSDKPVFLKCDGTEEFYIRVGASSLQIIGSKILEYIAHKFRKI